MYIVQHSKEYRSSCSGHIVCLLPTTTDMYYGIIILTSISAGKVKGYVKVVVQEIYLLSSGQKICMHGLLGKLQRLSKK